MFFLLRSIMLAAMKDDLSGSEKKSLLWHVADEDVEAVSGRISFTVV